MEIRREIQGIAESGTIDVEVRKVYRGFSVELYTHNDNIWRVAVVTLDEEGLDALIVTLLTAKEKIKESK